MCVWCDYNTRRILKCVCGVIINNHRIIKCVVWLNTHRIIKCVVWL